MTYSISPQDLRGGGRGGAAVGAIHSSMEFHHFGIPTTEFRPNERYSQRMRMYTSDNAGDVRVQWHRFEDDSPLHPLIRQLPHVAFKVRDLISAVRAKEVILDIYEPISGFLVAMINDGGVPIELIQTHLSDDEVWGRARNTIGQLYERI